MQMLHAGGMPILTDGQRQADADNPRGYYEWERIKRLLQEPDCIAEAEGKAVKVISTLLFALPDHRPGGREYRIVFLRRPLEEVVASQAAMIRRLGTQGSALPPAAMVAALEAHRKQVTAWLSTRSQSPVCWVDYHKLLDDARGEAIGIQQFLQVPLDVEAMAGQIEPTLYRQRQPSASLQS